MIQSRKTENHNSQNREWTVTGLTYFEHFLSFYWNLSKSFKTLLADCPFGAKIFSTHTPLIYKCASGNFGDFSFSGRFPRSVLEYRIFWNNHVIFLLEGEKIAWCALKQCLRSGCPTTPLRRWAHWVTKHLRHLDFIFSSHRVSDASNIHLLDYWPLLAEVVQCCLKLRQDVLTCFWVVNQA